MFILRVFVVFYSMSGPFRAYELNTTSIYTRKNKIQRLIVRHNTLQVAKRLKSLK